MAFWVVYKYFIAFICVLNDFAETVAVVSVVSYENSSMAGTV